jgi:hypothetical protein
MRTDCQRRRAQSNCPPEGNRKIGFCARKINQNNHKIIKGRSALGDVGAGPGWVIPSGGRSDVREWGSGACSKDRLVRVR